VFEPGGATFKKVIVQEELVASNIYNKGQVDELFGTWAYRLPDDALGISKVDDLQRQLDDINAIRAAIQVQLAGAVSYSIYTQDDLTALTSVVATKQGTLGTSSALDVASVACGELTAGATVINSPNDVSLIVGNDDSFLRIKHGRHLDAYNRDGGGVDINLCNHTQSAVRIATKMSIGMTPNAYQLAVSGAANITDFCMCPAYRIGSDQRLKESMENASLGECTRLVLAVRPQTYILKATGQAQLGYRAQDFERESQDAYRNSIVGEALGDDKLLALDYSRIVPVLHGALLNALARIEALENRLT
jgi:hypothetical protein